MHQTLKFFFLTEGFGGGRGYLYICREQVKNDIMTLNKKQLDLINKMTNEADATRTVIKQEFALAEDYYKLTYQVVWSMFVFGIINDMEYLTVMNFINLE